MVAFRKLSPAFAVAALMLGSVSAYAQGTTTTTPLTCAANSGVAPTVRAEGLTELLGDLVINCTGGNPSAPFLVNFQIFLNTNVTSRLTGSTYDALLLVDEPGVALNAGTAAPFCVSPDTPSNSATTIPGLGAPTGTAPTCNPGTGIGTTAFQTGTYNVFRGVRPNVSSDTSIVWPGIPVVPPGSNRVRSFRFVNIRGNAASIGATTSGLPNQIIAFISTNPQGTLAIDNPQQTVGYVQQGLVFDVRNCGNTGGVAQSTFFQCGPINQERFNTPTSGSLPSNLTSGQTTNNSVLGLRFREGFQTAFKIRGITGQESSLPGQVFNTESGFVNPATGTAGVADTGTRLMARFNNVPAGVRLFVSTSSVGGLQQTNVTAGSSANARALLVSADPQGGSFANTALPFGSTAPTQVAGPVTINCPDLVNFTGVSAVEVPITGGAGMATWEVTAADQSNLDTLEFLVGFAFATSTTGTTATPGLGQATVTGSFAPMFTATNAGTAGFAPALIPRFTAGTAAAANLFQIAACSTNLLFPFVTNQAGFDTGIAISNTSQDPFSAANANSGACTMNYYGSLPGGAPLTTTSERTTSAIQAGQTLTMVLSTGGGFGIRGNANMQGYIIAVCDFRFAHGFAFITDGPIGQARVAEGYLAIVLDGAHTIRGNSNGESQGQ